MMTRQIMMTMIAGGQVNNNDNDDGGQVNNDDRRTGQ